VSKIMDGENSGREKTRDSFLAHNVFPKVVCHLLYNDKGFKSSVFYKTAYSQPSRFF